MLAPGTAANPSWEHEPNGYTGLGAKVVGEFKRPVTLATLVLAVLGWLAAAFSFWQQPDGQKRQQSAPAEHSEDQEKALAESNTTQQQLATAQSALSATTRMRDEAAQAQKEVRDRSAGVKKDLAAARDLLDDVQQKITARNAELTTISKRLDTARLRETLEKQKVNASPRTGAKVTGAMAAPGAAIPKEPAAPIPTDEPTGSVTPNTAASRPEGAVPAAARVPVKPVVSPPKTIDRPSSKISQANPSNAPAPTSALKPSIEPSPAPIRKTKNALEDNKSIAVMGPGDFSSPSDFELHSGRVARTP